MKILFLSLGTGNLFSEVTSTAQDADKSELLKQMIDNGQYAYRTARYRIGDKTYESPFVAEALIDNYAPDHILLVGTVKSAWSSFYARYFESPDKLNNLMRLYEQEQKYGLVESRDSEKLDAFENTIKSIIPDSLTVSGKDISLDIKLLSYGINQEELDFNFRELSQKWKSIVEGIDERDIDIAFDITHSFRSMPLYNVVIINYLLKTSSKNMKLSHVYYGNLDAARENNGIAEIVDLNAITDYFSLTEGIAEFNNSGNASMIISEIRGEDPVMAEKLEEFDWAIQTNRLLSLIDAVKALKQQLAQSMENSEYSPVYEMLQSVLEQSFPSDEDLRRLDNIDDNITAYAHIQRSIGLWHLQHGRYGQAFVVADESFRSYIAALYIKRRGELKREKLFDTRQRKIAFDTVIKNKDITKYVAFAHICPQLANFLPKVKDSQQKIYDDRNVFAHFLWSATYSAHDPENYDHRQVKKDIQDFYDELLLFEKCIDSDPVAAVDYMKALSPLASNPNIADTNTIPQPPPSTHVEEAAQGSGTAKKRKKKKKVIDTTIHYFEPKELSKKGSSVFGTLEDGTDAMLKVAFGTKLNDLDPSIQVHIIGKGPQQVKHLVEEVKTT